MKHFLQFLILIFLVHNLSIGATIEIVATTVCLGEVSDLSVNTDIDPTTIENYYWDLDNDGYFNDATGKAIQYKFSKSGENLINLMIRTKSALEILMETPKVVIINPLPKVDFEFNNVCEKTDAAFRNNTTIENGTISSYKWDVYNDNSIDGTLPDLNTQFNATGNFEVKLIAQSNKGCENSLVKNITIYSKPSVNFGPNHTCEKNNTVFENLSTSDYPIVNNYWNFGDDQQSLLSAPTHVFQTSKVYAVRLTVINDKNCSYSLEKSIIVIKAPDLTFKYSADTVIYEGTDLVITAQGTFASILWSTSSTLNSITATTSGEYSATATSGTGCETKKSVNVIVKPKEEINLEGQILTPNGDGINDVLKIKNLNSYNQCAIKVFNKYGQIIFESANYQNDWDLNYQNKPLTEGVYYYVITANSMQAKGTINILR